MIAAKAHCCFIRKFEHSGCLQRTNLKVLSLKMLRSSRSQSWKPWLSVDCVSSFLIPMNATFSTKSLLSLINLFYEDSLSGLWQLSSLQGVIFISAYGDISKLYHCVGSGCPDHYIPLYCIVGVLPSIYDCNTFLPLACRICFHPISISRGISHM